MTRRDELTCASCGRRFWSEFTERRHRVGGRCRTDAGLLRIGLHLNPAGAWVRADPNTAWRQLRLIPVRGRPHGRAEKMCGGRASTRFQGGPASWDQEPLPGIPGGSQGLIRESP